MSILPTFDREEGTLSVPGIAGSERVKDKKIIFFKEVLTPTAKKPEKLGTSSYANGFLF